MNDTKRSYRKLKLRARRSFRKQKKQVEKAAVEADNSVEKLVFKRIHRLVPVRRFVAVWISLVLLIGLGAVWQVRGLDEYYLELEPTNGGVYREGLLGSFTTSNPLFASTVADVSVSRLVFSGLFQLSPDGSLQPDLATGYTVDERALVYTVKLRNDVVWHDGDPFDADDVMFTYQKIKSSDVGSPLFSSWRDVVVSQIDQYTVSFTLPNVLASFHYSLTNGIVPSHILGSVEEADLRSSLFNTESAVGTGPFMFESVEVVGTVRSEFQEKVSLQTNENYHRVPALIDGVVIRTYGDEDSLVAAFEEQEITSMVGLRELPENIANDATVQSFSTPLLSSVMLFMNNSNDILSDKNVRRAIVQATNTDGLRQMLNYQLIESDSPFLRSHFAHDEAKVQLPYNIDAARQLLDEAGWAIRSNGKREKDGQSFKLRLVSQSLSEYSAIVQGLQQQWSEIGLEVEAVLQPEEEIQTGAVSLHDYDVLLYGVSIGPDPDVFAYWHSSQFDERLQARFNLSEFKNDAADEALEAGRTRLDEDLRSVKYEPFLDAWRDDAPAIAIYQPRFLFVARGTLDGYLSGQFESPSDRYFSITDWRVRSEKTIK